MGLDTDMRASPPATPWPHQVDVDEQIEGMGGGNGHTLQG